MMLIAAFYMCPRTLRDAGPRAAIARTRFSFLTVSEYTVVMQLRRTYRLIALIAAFCVALSSVASAQRMVPADVPSLEMQAFFVAGGTLDDLCLTNGSGHVDHDCPFCRLLADPEQIAPANAAWTELQPPPDQRLVNLTPRDLRLALDVSARGPPCSA